MMKRSIAIASMVAVSLTAGLANAELVAGWDFSQYRAAGFPTIDGSTGVQTLTANYSSQDPSGNAGAGAAAAGTMFMDGTQGSTNVNVSPAAPDVSVVHDFTSPPSSPPGGAVPVNLNGTVAFGAQNEFNAFSLLRDEGQVNQTYSALSAINSSSVVFQADAGSSTTRSWAVTFGARTFGNADPNAITVEYSLGCTGGYAPAVAAGSNPVTFDGTAGVYSYAIGAGTDQTNCVRLNMNTGTARPIVDNVAVPEPGVASMLVTGVLGLIGLGRLRRA